MGVKNYPGLSDCRRTHIAVFPGGAAAAGARRSIAFARRLVRVALRQFVDAAGRRRRRGGGGGRRAARAGRLASGGAVQRRRGRATVAVVRRHLIVDVVDDEVGVALLAVAVLPHPHTHASLTPTTVQGDVFVGDSLLVCPLAALRKHYSTDFYKIRRNGRT